MRLYEELKYKSKRIVPSKCWHEATANWIATCLGDIYNDNEKLFQCYSPKRNNPNDEGDYPNIIYDYIKQFRGKGELKQPFIIYGPPAIGKTTYLSYQLKINLPRKFGCKIYPIFFDLRDVSDFKNLSVKFIEKIESELIKKPIFKIFQDKSSREKQLKIYIEMFKDKLASQLIEFDPDDYSNIFENEKLKERIEQIVEDRYLSIPKLTCIKKIDYLTKKNKVYIVFVIDNFDHRDKYEDMHQSVYDLAKEVLVDFGRPVFLPMRNYTFLDSYDRYGFIESGRNRNKSLSAPILSEVFERRKNYILSKISNRIKLAIGKGVRFDISPDIIKHELEIIMKGISENNNIMTFLENVSGENIRVYLDLVLNTIQSGHLFYTKKIDGSVALTYKSFVKACAFCNNFIFKPTEGRNPIINIYDNGEVEGRKNLLIRIRILQYLRHASSPVTVKDITGELNFLGYREESILSALKILRSNGLADELPYYRAVGKISLNQQFVVTTIGVFYLEHLSKDCVYFELMSASCNLPRSYKNDAEKIVTQKEETKRHRRERHDSLNRILSYFKHCEYEERRKSSPEHYNASKYYNLTPQISLEIESEYSLVLFK